MGYDLEAKKKDEEGFSMGAFSWSWMLSSGVGWCVGTGAGFSGGQYVERVRPDGNSLNANDGASVTEDEAKAMACAARWLADYQDLLNDLWEQESEERREEMRRIDFYNTPVRRDFVEKARDFADWAEKSGGFFVW